MITAQQVRRPLVGIALSVVAGIGVQHGIGGAPLLWFAAGAFLLALLGQTIFRRSSSLLIYIAFGLLAASYSSIEKSPSFLRAVLPIAEVAQQEQDLIGAIEDEPTGSGDGQISFLFRLETILYEGTRRPCDATIKVYLKDSSVTVRFGEKWRMRGRYTSYEQPRVGTDGTLNVSAGGAIRLREAGPSLTRSCYVARQRAAEILCEGIGAFPNQLKLLHALLLGYRQAMPSDLYRLFSRTGILHIFAISGLHVGVMAAILIAALKITGISRPRWGWLLIPALFIYVLSTGMKASALRAFTMAAVYFAAPLVGRRPDAPSAVALAGILILILNPANITDPGFLLSFVVVCGILMVHGWVIRQMNGLRFSRWESPLRQLNGPHPTTALLRAAGLLMITSFAAWIFSAPITARFFNTLSPVALVGNLAVIPLTFMIMLTGCLALLSGLIFLPAAALFNQANLLFINLLLWVVGRLAVLPGSCWIVRSPTVWVTGLWYAGLTLFFTGPARWRRSALLMVGLSVILWVDVPRIRGRDIRILRNSDSAVAIYAPEKNRWMLITDGDPFCATRTMRLLKQEGVNQLDELVVTGGKADRQTIQQIQESFHPQQTRYQDEASWVEGAGVIRILQPR
jgi:competence protein ComEC